MAKNNNATSEGHACRRRYLRDVDDKHLLCRDDLDNGGHRKPAQLAALPNFEVRGKVRVVVRKEAFDCPAAASRDREADAVRQPVAGNSTGGGEPLGLGQHDAHHAHGTPPSPHAKLR